MAIYRSVKRSRRCRRRGRQNVHLVAGYGFENSFTLFALGGIPEWKSHFSYAYYFLVLAERKKTFGKAKT